MILKAVYYYRLWHTLLSVYIKCVKVGNNKLLLYLVGLTSYNSFLSVAPEKEAQSQALVVDVRLDRLCA
jgi:hypothetical protein